ncbi:MAG: hypothetical protein U0821_16035 [Chloroflexota bacterium]
MQMLRTPLAILGGLAVSFVIIGLVESVSSAMYPLPEGVAPTDVDALRSFIRTLPVGAFVMVLAAWALGALGGAWVAGRLAGRAQIAHGLAVAAFGLGAAIANMVMLPHPAAMWVGAFVEFPLCGYLGGRWAGATARA